MQQVRMVLVTMVDFACTPFVDPWTWLVWMRDAQTKYAAFRIFDDFSPLCCSFGKESSALSRKMSCLWVEKAIVLDDSPFLVLVT